MVCMVCYDLENSLVWSGLWFDFVWTMVWSNLAWPGLAWPGLSFGLAWKAPMDHNLFWFLVLPGMNNGVA